MKSKLLILAAFMLGTSYANAQQYDTRSKIDIVGQAEREVTPDVIYINVMLKEYFENNNTKKRVDLTSIENEFFKAAKDAGIDTKNITINSIGGYQNAVKRKKNPEFLDSKNYKIKVANLNAYNDLTNGIDPKALVYSNISSYEYSKIKELKNELRIEAAKDAKEKANTLVTILGGKLAKPISISEVDFGTQEAPVYMRAMSKMNMVAEAADAAAPEIDFKTIKVKSQVNVTFETLN